MSTLFTTVFNMSITATYIAIGVLVIRLFLRRLPKLFSYALWLAVFIRLICPVSFTSAISFLSFVKPDKQGNSTILEYVPYNIGFMQNPTVDMGISNISHAINSLLPAAIPYSSMNPMQVYMPLISIVWLFGIFVLLSYSVFSYLKVINNVRTATLVRDNIYESDRIEQPFVCGFIKPRIYIPIDLPAEQLSYIIAHEQTHIRRLDYLVKPFAFLVLIVHWFNPVMWVSFSLMSKDMEMSCDESVIKKLGSGSKGSYSNSLLSLATKGNGLFVGSPLGFGENHIKARIKNIITYKKPAFWVVVVAIISIGCLIVMLIANPRNAELQLAEATKLPDFHANVSDPIEQLVYDSAIEQYGGSKDGFTIVAPTIFGSYEEGNKLKVFVTVHSLTYKLYDTRLIETGGAVVPAAITYTKQADGGYILDEYLEAMDGSYNSKSIKEFSVMPVSKKEIEGIADRILGDEGNDEKRSLLLMENLQKHLTDNGINGITDIRLAEVILIGS